MCFWEELDALQIDSLTHFTYTECPIERDGQIALSCGTLAEDANRFTSIRETALYIEQSITGP